MGKITPNKPLKEAMEHMRQYDLEYMSVVADDQSDELVGILDYRMINRKISAEVLARQQKADSLHKS